MVAVAVVAFLGMAAMVDRQLVLRGVQDPRVLEAMRNVDRAFFVPEEMKPHAYEDRALPIGYGQTISQPYIVALMSELLELKGHERVLEIGTGSGYQAAVLGELAGEVYTIEIVPELADRSKHLLRELGYKNIHVRGGDGYQGWKEKAPFDAVIVTCAPERLPRPLVDQLQEGGRLVIPVGAQPAQHLYQYQKVKGQLVERPIIAVSFVPMTGGGGISDVR